MTNPQDNTTNTGASRREFLMTSAVVGGAAAVGLGPVPMVHAGGAESIRVGVIGCGGRGTGAAGNILDADPSVRILAIGDAFPDRFDNFKSNLAKYKDRIDLGDRTFTGLDSYKKVLDCDIDLVILATPPGFRPIHIDATINAGKHLFTEKPVGVDGPGIRKVLEAHDRAVAKKLAVVAGTQRRHQGEYLASMEQIHNGGLGDILSGRCYWNQGSLWKFDRKPGMSDAEWQIRNWLYFAWLSGDHIVEQHVHNLDVMNWALKGHPEKAMGMGGRQVRTDPAYGHIFDHFAIEYTYPNDVVVQSYCRQIPGCANNVSESLVGTEGRWSSNSHRIAGKNAWRYRPDGKKVNPYVQEHIDLIASIRAGQPLAELKTVAESTLTAIMGRMSAYTGKEVTWEEALNSTQNLYPPNLTMESSLPVPPVATPGQTELS